MLPKINCRVLWTNEICIETHCKNLGWTQILLKSKANPQYFMCLTRLTKAIPSYNIFHRNPQAKSAVSEPAVEGCRSGRAL